MQVKQRKRKARALPGAGEDAPLRRSGRVANLPEKPKYRDVCGDSVIDVIVFKRFRFFCWFY